MATIVAFEGAEAEGATVGNNTAGMFAQVTGTLPTYDTAVKRSGAAAMKWTYAGGLQSFFALPTDDWTATNFIVSSFYFRIPAAPAVGCLIAHGAVSSTFPDIQLNAARTITALFSGGTGPTSTTSTTVCPVDAWHRIDFKLDTSALLFKLDVKLTLADGTTETLTQVSTTAAATATTNIWRIGPATASASLNGFVIYYDDIVVSNASADYPLGEYKMLRYLPNADGAHSVGTATYNLVTANGLDASGTVVTNSTTNLWTVVDEWPVTADGNAADDWMCKTAGTLTTDYTEIAFADPAVGEVAPEAVRVIVALRNHTGTTANNARIIPTLSGTEAATNAFNASINSATTIYRGRLYRLDPAGGAWSRQDLVDLAVRFKSSDVAPIPRIKALMLQAAYPVAGGDATVVVGTGSATAAGTAAATQANSTAVVGTGTATAAGTAAAAVPGTVIAVGTGSADAAGTSAAVRASSAPSVGTGSATASGTAASPQASSTVAVGTGSATTAGTATTTQASSTIAVGTGSASASGTAAAPSGTGGTTVIVGTGSATASGTAAIPVIVEIPVEPPEEEGHLGGRAIRGAPVQRDATVKVGTGRAWASGTLAFPVSVDGLEPFVIRIPRNATIPVGAGAATASGMAAGGRVRTLVGAGTVLAAGTAVQTHELESRHTWAARVRAVREETEASLFALMSDD